MRDLCGQPRDFPTCAPNEFEGQRKISVCLPVTLQDCFADGDRHDRWNQPSKQQQHHVMLDNVVALPKTRNLLKT